MNYLPCMSIQKILQAELKLIEASLEIAALFF